MNFWLKSVFQTQHLCISCPIQTENLTEKLAETNIHSDAGLIRVILVWGDSHLKRLVMLGDACQKFKLNP